MKKLTLFLFALLSLTVANAQILKGDMDGDGKITMSDANDVVNTSLGLLPLKYIKPSSFDNRKLFGTWYDEDVRDVYFREDGATNFTSCFTYDYYPSFKALLFFDNSGALVSMKHVESLTEEEMTIVEDGVTKRYTRTKPDFPGWKSDNAGKPNSVSSHKYVVEVKRGDVLAFDWTVSSESYDEFVVELNGVELMRRSGEASGHYQKNFEYTGVCVYEVFYVKDYDYDGGDDMATVTNFGMIACFDPGETEDVKAVDLGLPSGIKWASCNLGAYRSTDYGNYYQWGETTGYYEAKMGYNWYYYSFTPDGVWTDIRKYTVPDNQKKGIWYDGSTFIGDKKTQLDLEDDAAHVNWGGDWRMPTYEEARELTLYCKWTPTTVNGVNGHIVTSKTNGNSIFIPCAGSRTDYSEDSFGTVGLYWTSTLYNSDNKSAYSMSTSIRSVDAGVYSALRYKGMPIRPVCP